MATRRDDARTPEQITKAQYELFLNGWREEIEAAIAAHGQLGFTLPIQLYRGPRNPKHPYDLEQLLQRAFDVLIKEYRSAGWHIEYKESPSHEIQVTFK